MPNIKKLRIEKKKFYKKIISIYCPVLNEVVYFTSEGFNHLLYKRHKTPRTIKEQYMKLMCISYITSVVQNAQKISETRIIKRKIHNEWKNTIYYELVYEVYPEMNIRVILEKTGSGKIKFKSVMPNDKKSKLKSVCFRRF